MPEHAPASSEPLVVITWEAVDAAVVGDPGAKLGMADPDPVGERLLPVVLERLRRGNADRSTGIQVRDWGHLGQMSRVRHFRHLALRRSLGGRGAVLGSIGQTETPGALLFRNQRS